jgi:hypothetical protein
MAVMRDAGGRGRGQVDGQLSICTCQGDSHFAILKPSNIITFTLKSACVARIFLHTQSYSVNT